MSERLTNEEILNNIAELSEEERNRYGVSSELQSAAARAASGNRTALASFWEPYTAVYNGFVGFIAKFALSQLSKATYNDLYAAHHRNMVQGRPQLGFVDRAKQGTGNASQQFAANPAIGGLTTVVTAEMPDIIALYDITVHDYVARIPVSTEDVKTAMTSEYGISDLYTLVREGLEDAIIEDRNATYDDAMSTVVAGAIPAGTGSQIAANAAKATYTVVPGQANWAEAVATGDLSAITEDQLTQVFVTIKNTYYGVTGRPQTRYNALGVRNNKTDNVVCYVWAPLYAEMSRVKASAFNLNELLDSGLRMVPLVAPWLGIVLDNGNAVLGAIGSADFIRDYPTSDFASTVPTDRGVIECRFMTTQLAIAGYEPFVVLCGNNLAAQYKFTGVANESGSPSLSEVLYISRNGVISNRTGSFQATSGLVTAAGIRLTINKGSLEAGTYNVTMTASAGGVALASAVTTGTVASGSTWNAAFGRALYDALITAGIP